MNKINLSLDLNEFEKRLSELKDKAEIDAKYIPSIVNAWINNSEINIILNNQVKISFPQHICQEICNLNSSELNKVKVGPGGNSIYWENSATGIELSSILAGRFGNKKWMSEMNKKYGIPLGNQD